MALSKFLPDNEKWLYRNGRILGYEVGPKIYRISHIL